MFPLTYCVFNYIVARILCQKHWSYITLAFEQGVYMTVGTSHNK